MHAALRTGVSRRQHLQRRLSAGLSKPHKSALPLKTNSNAVERRVLPFPGAIAKDKQRLKSPSSGIAFEVPIAIAVLARMGIITIAQLKTWRGYFVFCAFAVSAGMTPPDVNSQLAVDTPIYILHAMGIIAAQLFIKHIKAPNSYAAAQDKLFG